MTGQSTLPRDDIELLAEIVLAALKDVVKPDKRERLLNDVALFCERASNEAAGRYNVFPLHGPRPAAITEDRLRIKRLADLLGDKAAGEITRMHRLGADLRRSIARDA